MVQELEEINFLIAFIAGFVTFFASCLLPLVPTYLAYLAGVGLREKELSKKKLTTNAFLFVFGFVMVFVVLGIFSTSIGKYLNAGSQFITIFGGLFLILMGIFLLGIIKINLPINIKHKITRWEKLNSLIFGITFGTAWTPCIGPILGVILFWASQSATASKGAFLLFFFGIGLGLPFLIIAILFENLIPLIKKLGKASYYINLISASFIILAGILLVTGRFHLLSLEVINILHLRSLSF